MTVQTKFTYKDYLLFPDDGRRHELIDGGHYMTPAPSIKHQHISVTLCGAIWQYLTTHPLGKVFTAPCDIVLSKTDVVQPDLVFISSAKVSIIAAQNIQGIPDLLVEILSEATRKTDEVVKRTLYERVGVSEYWIVDPELETVKVYRITPHGYVLALELSRNAGDVLSTPLLPDLTLPLTTIFA